MNDPGQKGSVAAGSDVETKMVVDYLMVMERRCGN